MRLLRFTINGLRLYDNETCTMNLYASDAVRNTAFVHPLDGAARNINTNTVIGIAGINASGKTTALRVIELALAVAGGLSLGTVRNDLAPLFDMAENTVKTRILFEQDGRFRILDSELALDDDPRTPIRFIRETMHLHHGRLGKNRIATIFDHPLPDSWTVESSRNIGHPGVKGELSKDARRYLPVDRSISGAVVDGPTIIADLLPVMPMLNPNPAGPVIGLFDPSIEHLDRDADGIHLKFRDDARERNPSPESLISLVSAGTLRGGALMANALHVLKHGGYLLVDELENSINKQLIFVIIDLFASPVTNPKGATLVFTTHYPELLDHFDRKDSIWFAVRRDHGFRLENLGDHLGRTDVKKSISFFADKVPGTTPSYADIHTLRDYVKEQVNG